MAKIMLNAKSPRTVRKTAKEAKVTPRPDSGSKTTKQAAVIALLRRQQGASIAEIVELTGWLPASTRGFMSGAVKKRLGIEVVSEKGEDGVRRYYVAPLKS